MIINNLIKLTKLYTYIIIQNIYVKCFINERLSMDNIERSNELREKLLLYMNENVHAHNYHAMRIGISPLTLKSFINDVSSQHPTTLYKIEKFLSSKGL